MKPPTRAQRILVFVVVLVLLVLWRAGSFDTTLAPIGLNTHPCGTTALTGTVCGTQYEALRRADEEPTAHEPSGISEALGNAEAEEHARTAEEHEEDAAEEAGAAALAQREREPSP